MIFELLHVKFIPKEIDPGIIYLSTEFGCAVHLCPCGCGVRVVTPTGSRDGWECAFAGGALTLYPSIKNLACNSHYYIRANRVVWC